MAQGNESNLGGSAAHLLVPSLVPEDWRADRRLVDRLFYAVPPKLIDALKFWTSDALDPSEVGIERAIGEACKGRTCVGFWKLAAMNYSLLQEMPNPADWIGRPPANREQDPFWKDLGWYDEA